jgi:hypothetical protein
VQQKPAAQHYVAAVWLKVKAHPGKVKKPKRIKQLFSPVMGK